MRLLLDQNLSHKLISQLAAHFQEIAHVRLLGFGQATDREIWEHARVHGWTIVTQDTDFFEMSLLLGFPPKVVWLRCGNTTTKHIANLLAKQVATIQTFIVTAEAGCLELS